MIESIFKSTASIAPFTSYADVLGTLQMFSKLRCFECQDTGTPCDLSTRYEKNLKCSHCMREENVCQVAMVVEDNERMQKYRELQKRMTASQRTAMSDVMQRVAITQIQEQQKQQERLKQLEKQKHQEHMKYLEQQRQRQRQQYNMNMHTVPNMVVNVGQQAEDERIGLFAPQQMFQFITQTMASHHLANGERCV